MSHLFPLWVALSHFESFQVFFMMVWGASGFQSLQSICAIWIALIHFQLVQVLWVLWNGLRFKWLWIPLSCYDLLWFDLSHFESLWVILSDFESLWVTLSHVESRWVTLSHFELKISKLHNLSYFNYHCSSGRGHSHKVIGDREPNLPRAFH